MLGAVGETKSGQHKDPALWWLTVQERREHPPANKCPTRGIERALEIIGRNLESLQLGDSGGGSAGVCVCVVGEGARDENQGRYLGEGGSELG